MSLEPMTTAAAQTTRLLPPHGPADMLDLFMTRYDYDYNRDPRRSPGGALDGSGSASGLDGQSFMSGDVRNRLERGRARDWNGNTIYRQDYVPKDRRVQDVAALAQRLASRPPGYTKNHNNSEDTAYTKPWYRANLSKHLTRDGQHPWTVYKTDYTAPGCPADHTRGDGGKGDGTKVQPTLYAGARSIPYKAELLHLPITDDDRAAEAALTVKITSPESLRPRLGGKAAACPSEPPALLPSRRGQLHILPRATTPGDEGTADGEYTCTSWTYGDTSLALPSQLPQGLMGSRRADLLPQGPLAAAGDENVAALLRALANQKRSSPAAAGTPYRIDDDTNPIFLTAAQQRQCAITRRLPYEGHVKRTIYAGDYIHQGRLPELPGNRPVPDVRDTRVDFRATPGETVSGTTTRALRQWALVRNTHGTLKRHVAPAVTARVPVTHAKLASMRLEEKLSSIDRADPHRHKLHTTM